MATKRVSKKTATTPRAPKPVRSIEEVTVKAVDSFTESAQKLTTQARNVVSQLEEAFIAKRTEFDELVEAIKLAEERRNQVLAEEQVGLQLQQLQEALQDAQHASTREIEQLNADHTVALAEIKRKHAEAKKNADHQFQDEQRRRQWEQQDAERKLHQMQQAKSDALAAKEKELRKLEGELGSFDDRVKAEVQKATSAIKRDHQFEARNTQVKYEADKRILEAEVERLKRENEALQAAKTSAETVAATAQQKVFDVASSAATAFSGREARETAEKLATESAKAPRR